MSNNLAAFNSEAWSNRMVTRLDQVNIMLPLVNRDWEGDLRQNKTVKIRTAGSISMGSYTRGTVISYQDLTPMLESFTVNDGEYFAFNVDDIDKAQSDISAMDVYMKRAVVAMNNIVETKLLSVYNKTPAFNIVSGATAGTGAAATAVLTNGVVTSFSGLSGGSGYGTTPPLVVLTPTDGNGAGALAHCTLSAGAVNAVVVDAGGGGYTAAPAVTFVGGVALTLDSTTSATTGIYQVICKIRTLQSNQNVPLSGRWLVIDPATTALLVQDTAHFIRASDLGDAIVQTAKIGGADVQRRAVETPGFVGRVLGFDVYESTKVPVSGGVKYLLAGDNEAISYAAQITEIEALRLQTAFADAVRGLILHDVFVPAEAGKRLASVMCTP
jgi:hypothetical protein